MLDPFIGSGSTAVAAIELSRQYLGIDTNSEFVELSRQRLSETQIKIPSLAERPIQQYEAVNDEEITT